MTITDIIQSKNVVSTFPNRGLSLASGNGVYLYDEKGEEYLDMGSNFGVNLLGYGPSPVTEGIKKQVDILINCHGSFGNPQRSQATKKLLEQVEKVGLTGFNRILWANYGAEAVDAAIKFALIATGRNRLLSPRNDYHGKTLAVLSVTSSNEGKYQKPFQKFLLSTDYFEFGNIESLKKTISNQHAALIIEPIQAEGGIILPPEDYLVQVSELCKEYGVLLIIDEIQTGLGRNGRFLNVQKYVPGGFDCDMILFGKGLGGGLPVSAVVIKEELNAKIPKGVHTSTTGGNPLSMTGVVAFLDELEKSQIIDKSRVISKYFFEQLRNLQTKLNDKIVDIRGEGFMIGVQLLETIDPMDILKKLQRRKIIALPCSKDTIRFLPPLIIQKEHVDKVCQTLEVILS